MSPRHHRAILIAAITTTVTALAGATAFAAPGTSRGPRTTVDPYVVPVADGVSTKSLLTVGDKPAANGYRMVGIPDGLGAIRNHSGTFDLFMNHELRPDTGIVRRHGQRGAFVSQWRIDRGSLDVRSGQDLIDPGVVYWDYVTQTYRATPSTGGPNPRRAGDTFEPQGAPFARFCSSTLSDPGQLYNRRSGRGYDGQLYFGNEENGNPGRSFGVTTDGSAQQLPRLGLFSWENTIPAPNRTDSTVVMGTEDTGPNSSLPNPDDAAGQLWVYSGTKTRTGNAFKRAGLTNGVSSVIDVADESVTNDAGFRSKYGKNNPAEVDLSEVDWDQSANAQNLEATRDGLSLNRIEDGGFDPRHPNDFYFLTTEGGDKTPAGGLNNVRDGGGLWKLSFEDVENPELGGTLTLLLDGSEAPKLNKPDNMDVDSKGNLLIQEDPGGNPHVARIVAYRISDGARGVLAEFDRTRFTPGGPKFMTEDEESSGIIDAKEILGSGWFLFDAQVHKASASPNVAEEVEEGQLLTMKVEDFDDVYGDDGED